LCVKILKARLSGNRREEGKERREERWSEAFCAVTGDEIGVEFLVRPNDREEDVVDDADGDEELEASRPACALVASRRAVVTSRLRDGSATLSFQYF
jgi:hypothetical protein